MASAKSKGKAVEPLPTDPKTFFDLPAETQHQIFKHCSQGDIICLALVSKHFRDLAASWLYRNFHIVFPDDDDPAFDSPIDSLAGGFETFVSSSYDYAQHVREFSLDTLSVGDKAESAYKAYLYSQSCGKFMNTLLLLTLRKTRSLETFRWNIRVELSRQVFQALHQIPSLRHLHLRMQAGPSLYEAPPPLPLNSSPAAHHTAPTANYWHPGPDSGFPSSSAGAGFSAYNAPGFPPASKPPASKNRRKATIDIDPPTISGFKKLKTLCVLDIDSLELVTEIKTCIRNSSLTLNKLKLSFSARLASQARKPKTADIDPEDEDPEEDFQVVPLPASSSSWSSAAPPVVAFRAQQERKVQEAVLGRIFDLEPYLVRQAPRMLQPAEDKTKESKEQEDSENTIEPSNPAKLFMDRLLEVSDQLAEQTEDGLSLDPDAKTEILDTIRRAADRYLQHVDENTKSPQEPIAEAQDSGTGSSSAPRVTKTSFQTSDKISSPDDIDIEEPIATEDNDENIDQQSLPDKDTPPSAPAASAEKTAETNRTPSPAVLRASMTLEVQKENFSKVLAQLHSLRKQATDVQNALFDMQDNGGSAAEVAILEKKVAEYGLWIKSNQEELDIVRREIQDAAKQAGVNNTEEDREYARVCDYLKSTRGIPLRSFNVHLVPLKAIVLKNAIDLHVLRRLTLLNVGSQTAIWTMIAKENKKSPLPLRKVFTDHACMAFLTCLKQLSQLEELFILERSESYKPESFAPKAGTTIEDIRQMVLKKHLPTLRKLMIKNDADTSWDVDEKTVLLICMRGKKLKELAFSLNIHGMHVLVQHLKFLENLYALHIAHFRSNDTCPWVMRETRRFIVDATWDQRDMKLEWLAIDDDSVMRIIRNKDNGEAGADKEGDKKKKKKKSKSSMSNVANAVNTAGWVPAGYPPMTMQDPTESASDSDDDDVPKKPKTQDGIHFYDIFDVRIFKKEVLSGRL